MKTTNIVVCIKDVSCEAQSTYLIIRCASVEFQTKFSVHLAQHSPRGGHVDLVSFWFRVMAASTRSSAQLQCKNLQDYLKALPIPVLDRLYNHPATCLAVFR